MLNEEVTFSNREHHTYLLHVGRYRVVRLALRSGYDIGHVLIGIRAENGVRVSSADQLFKHLDLTGVEGCWSLVDQGPYLLMTEFSPDGVQSIGVLQSVPRRKDQ